MISTKFTYNGITSDSMGVYLVRTSSGIITRPYVPARTVREDYPSQAQQPYFFGTQINAFTISLTFSTLDNTMTDSKLKTLASWLFQNDYKPFISDDNPNVIHYLMQIGEVKFETNGNREGYFTAEFRSKFPFALTTEATPTYNLTNNNTTTTITLNNESNVYEHYNPTYRFVVSSTPTSTATPTLLIKNLLDNNREQAFYSLNIGETLFVDNNKCLILSSTGEYRYGNMTGNWLRLIQGNNSLQITGKGTLTFTTQFPIFT